MDDEQGMPFDVVPLRMTWSGHDFLDAMRDEGIWKMAQDSILKPIGGVAFEVLKEWLKSQMRTKLGFPNKGPHWCYPCPRCCFPP
ncbi:MAG: DUF2513 domain-containing protein [Opitutaceae bacterium]|nr:DUF2513 domain-containing protein [Opitutaceae bacterium]